MLIDERVPGHALPPERLPMRLAEIHASSSVGDLGQVVVRAGSVGWQATHLADVLVGAGFVVDSLAPSGDGSGWLEARVTRARTLPDWVGPDMALLVCGLNPSLYAADAGIGFARPGNRFWPAAVAAGIVDRDRDPRDALFRRGVGMTDLVKRATARADELAAAEYRDGLRRIERLAAWLRPGAVCFVGLAGWRAAADRRAVAGVQTERLGDVPVYLMPSTSGLNARVGPDVLAAHLRAALSLASVARDPGSTSVSR